MESAGRFGYMAPALVVLAAGMGSRYGGDKQLAAVGPGGATIIDYLVFDALRSGFGEIVLVIRPGMEAAMRDGVAARFGKRAPVRFVEQRLDDLPSGAWKTAERQKPWGTGQAVLAAARTITTPFGVVNADDLYGREAFAALGTFLADADGRTTFALVGFPLSATLSANGGVNRGVCRVDQGGMLDRIREVIGIEPHDGGGAYKDADGAVHVLPGHTPVSMNMWGFTPAIVPLLDSGFREFLTAKAGDAKAEFLLPSAIEAQVRAGQSRVRVLTGAFTWHGVTYPQDRDAVAEAIRDLVGRGVYPEQLDA